ncbi:nicotinate-nucleotide adenylyltransferase [Lutimaribacter pacificus]|uniref:Probable nicotinate-nucleotide adenylyltransferase n=1 Tax=Lutimaribacter pacificus TaxID=391948 RepID=A0A1H0L004_9RHOB|nr:nicotinate-nucleotide adenylyltransferase [Lutimaribacter pacificus]SDO61614.1 nicotinate-nucleotide adenylyltransferase [Lutimaribacter pacificus]SHK72146.1 nicotinate-nucleotide adenylyltransferase [Lutimaribacter pacificus]
MRHALPHARAGQAIGLLGGSFDPAHEGHAHITREALRRFGLDAVWWLVSPGNPLKDEGPADIAARIARAREVMQHPRVTVTDIEARTGTRYTAETLGALTRLYPGVRFVWLMGADNLAQLDRWQDWQEIMEHVPVGVLARPGQRISARSSKAARIYRAAKLPARASHRLAWGAAPRWCFVNVPMVDISSTRIRRSGGWPHAGA